MEQKLINAYCAALVLLSREGSTYRAQALEMLRELSHPDNGVWQMLSDVDRMPGNSWEFYLKSTAHGLCHNTSL